MKIGTRGSPLALQQSEEIARLFGKIDPSVKFEIKVIRSVGDKDRRTPLDRFQSPGVFTGALESALAAGKIDFAVHSMKDLPTQTLDDLEILCVPPRADVRDALVYSHDLNLGSGDLPAGLKIATGSRRRRAQLSYAFPGIKFVDVRGNIETRLKKLDDGEFDALFIAAAAIDRLAISPQAHPRRLIDTDTVLPAPAQGAIAVQCRKADLPSLERFRAAGDRQAEKCTAAERAVLAELGTGCSAPVAVYCAPIEDGRLCLHARYFPSYPTRIYDVVDIIQLGRSEAVDDLIGRVTKFLHERRHGRV